MTTGISIDRLSIRIPLKVRRFGGRKMVIAPEDEAVQEKPRAVPDDTLRKALARAHRWKRLLERGKVRSMNELAEQEKITPSYIARIYRLTLLAPDITEAILEGRQPRTLQLAEMIEDFPVEWDKQREKFGWPAFVPKG